MLWLNFPFPTILLPVSGNSETYFLHTEIQKIPKGREKPTSAVG
jgi:hypothetical protein